MHLISLLVFSLAAITTTFGEVIYFNYNVTENFEKTTMSCYEGIVTLTEDNIQLLSRYFPGSCTTYLGLLKKKCPEDTYGCFVSSTNPYETPAIGDTLSFGCGDEESCDVGVGYNCCSEDCCNCFECDEYIPGSENVPMNPRCDTK
jgi:hypothetical protein